MISPISWCSLKLTEARGADGFLRKVIVLATTCLGTTTAGTSTNEVGFVDPSDQPVYGDQAIATGSEGAAIVDRGHPSPGPPSPGLADW